MSNDTYKALIDAMVAEQARELGTTKTDKVFENIANSLILEPFDMSVDEIDSGVTDGSGDGQIDAMYVIVNGSPLTGEDDEEIPEKGPFELDILLIQSKNTDSFEENPLKSIRTTVADLVDLNRKYESYFPNYNETLQDKFALARRALLASAGRTAKIRVRVSYATKGRTDNIHFVVSATADALKADLSRLAATTDVEVKFLGAEELINLSRQPKTRKRDLEVQQHLSSDSGDSFACLVTIDSLVKFLSDEKGDLIRSLFDANVRDFLGKTEVNEAIRATLDSISEEDFWWLIMESRLLLPRLIKRAKSLLSQSLFWSMDCRPLMSCSAS